MKVIKTISKENDSRVGQCVDGSSVVLVSWLKSDDDIVCAVKCWWSAYNIFKVEVDGISYPFRHPKSWYIDSIDTKVFI